MQSIFKSKLFLGIILGIILGGFSYSIIINIDKISNYCNTNEGFVSAILTFVSAIIALSALLYSIIASKKQKEFQADLQKRQIKLDLFKEKFECYHVLYTLVLLRYRCIKTILDYSSCVPNIKQNFIRYKITKKQFLNKLNYASNNLYNFEKMLENLKKLALFFPEKNQEELFNLFNFLHDITIRYMMIEQYKKNNSLYNFEKIINELYNLYTSLEPLGTKYLPILEKELNLHGIDNIEITKVTTSN